MDDDEDDSELRVKANVSKVIPGVRVVEAVTKKHGVYKLSINDIVGASKYKPDELKGAEIGNKHALEKYDRFVFFRGLKSLDRCGGFFTNTNLRENVLNSSKV